MAAGTDDEIAAALDPLDQGLAIARLVWVGEGQEKTVAVTGAKDDGVYTFIGEPVGRELLDPVEVDGGLGVRVSAASLNGSAQARESAAERQVEELARLE